MRTRARKQNPHRSRLKANSRRGAMTVEFALTSLLFFFTVFACLDMARVFMLGSIAEDAVYVAARDAMVPGATKSEVQTVAQDILNVMACAQSNVVVEPFRNGVLQSEINDETQFVKVSVEIPVAANSLVVPRWFADDAAVSATSTRLKSERYQGFYDGSSTN